MKRRHNYFSSSLARNKRLSCLALCHSCLPFLLYLLSLRSTCEDSGKEHTMRLAPMLEKRTGQEFGAGKLCKKQTTPSTNSSSITAQGPVLNSSYCTAPTLPASSSPWKGISIGFRLQGIPQKAFHTLWLGNGYRKLLKDKFLITKPSLKQQSAPVQICPVPPMLDNRRETKHREYTVLFHERCITDLEK